MAGMTNRGVYLMLVEYFRNPAEIVNIYAALLTVQNEQTIDNAAAVNVGGGVVGIPVTTHGYTAGDRVVIENTTNYDGSYYVLGSSTANQVNITATYVAETFAGTELIHEAPGREANTLSEFTQIAVGNGYADGGLQLARNATDFDVLTEDDTNQYAFVQAKDLVYTASGGNLPASGRGARYMVFTTDEGTVANRQIIGWYDLGSDRTVSDGQSLTLQNAEARLAQP